MTAAAASMEAVEEKSGKLFTIPPDGDCSVILPFSVSTLSNMMEAVGKLISVRTTDNVAPLPAPG